MKRALQGASILFLVGFVGYHIVSTGSLLLALTHYILVLF
jgi:hypothetical protein